jgi:hypothetical protein
MVANMHKMPAFGRRRLTACAAGAKILQILRLDPRSSILLVACRVHGKLQLAETVPNVEKATSEWLGPGCCWGMPTTDFMLVDSERWWVRTNTANSLRRQLDQ